MAVVTENFCGFETGGLEELQNTVGSPTVSGTSQRNGSFKLVLPGASTATEVAIDVGTPANNLAVGVAFRYTASSAGERDILVFRDAGGDAWRVSVDPASGGDVKAYDSLGGQIGSTATAAMPSTDTWYYVEVYFQASASAIFQVNVDGSSIISGITVDLFISGLPQEYAMKGFGASDGDVWVDDIYSLGGLTLVSELLGPLVNIPRAYQNTAGGVTELGNALDFGSWATVADTPASEEADDSAAEYNGASVDSGGTLTDAGSRSGPTGGPTIGTISGGKWIWLLKRGTGSGTTHSGRYGSSGDFLANLTWSLGSSYQYEDKVLDGTSTYVPTTAEYFRQGFGKSSGGREILCSDMWAMLLTVDASGTDTSDNQAAYLKGIADTSDNQAAYLAGSLDASDSQSAYVSGILGASASQPAFLAGTATASDAQPAYLAGSLAASDSAQAYLAGGLDVSDNQLAFLAGADTALDNQPAFLAGSLSVVDNQSAFLAGVDTALDSQPAFLAGSIDVSDSQAAFLAGGLDTSSSKSAYLQGDVLAALDNQAAFLAGTATALDNQAAFLAGTATALDSQPAFLAGALDVVDNQPAFLAGGLDVVDSQPAFLAGGIDVVDNQPAFLAGTATALDNQVAFLAGGLDVVDNQVAFLAGGLDVVDNQAAFLAGSIDVVDNQAAFLAGTATALGSQAAYLAGTDTALDNQAAYLAGTATALDNQAAFLAGGLGAADSQAAYAQGQDTALDSQAAYASGSIDVSDSQAAYMTAVATASDSQSAYTSGLYLPLPVTELWTGSDGDIWRLSHWVTEITE